MGIQNALSMSLSEVSHCNNIHKALKRWFWTLLMIRHPFLVPKCTLFPTKGASPTVEGLGTRGFTAHFTVCCPHLSDTV